MLILDKIDFESLTRDKARHFIMMKVLIDLKDIAIAYVYAPNN